MGRFFKFSSVCLVKLFQIPIFVKKYKNHEETCLYITSYLQ